MIYPLLSLFEFEALYDMKNVSMVKLVTLVFRTTRAFAYENLSIFQGIACMALDSSMIVGARWTPLICLMVCNYYILTLRSFGIMLTILRFRYFGYVV